MPTIFHSGVTLKYTVNIKRNKLFFITLFTLFCSLLFDLGLRLEHTKGLHPLELLFRVIISVKVSICLFPWFVHTHVPCQGSDSCYPSGNNKIFLNLLDVHATHNRFGYLCNCRHGEVSLEVNSSNLS